MVTEWLNLMLVFCVMADDQQENNITQLWVSGDFVMENGWVDSKKNLRDRAYSQWERQRLLVWTKPGVDGTTEDKQTGYTEVKALHFFFFHLSAWWANLGTTILEGNGNRAQIQICLTPVHRSVTSEVWHYPLLKMRPAQGKRLNLSWAPSSRKEVRQQADPRLWQPVEGELQVEISEVWLFMLIQCTITCPWDFYRGPLVMFEVFNHFLLMFSLVLNILCNVYITLSPVESQFPFYCGHSPLPFKHTPSAHAFCQIISFPSSWKRIVLIGGQGLLCIEPYLFWESNGWYLN